MRARSRFLHRIVTGWPPRRRARPSTVEASRECASYSPDTMPTPSGGGAGAEPPARARRHGPSPGGPPRDCSGAQRGGAARRARPLAMMIPQTASMSPAATASAITPPRAHPPADASAPSTTTAQTTAAKRHSSPTTKSHQKRANAAANLTSPPGRDPAAASRRTPGSTRTRPPRITARAASPPGQEIVWPGAATAFSPSTSQNVPNVESSSPTLYLMRFSGTRESGRCTSAPTTSTTANAVAAPRRPACGRHCSRRRSRR